MTDIPQKFVVSHAGADSYQRHHFRPHLEMRDLGVADATQGAISIYLTRVTEGFSAEREPGMHHHLPDFQYFYVLKGWQKMVFEGEGEIVMRPGTGWLQARGIRHQVLDHSDDFEVLVIALPHKFETVEA
jgi:hypothetical protein